MPRVAPNVAAVWRTSPSSGPAYLLTSLFNAAQGILLITGGWARVDGPSFAIIREYGGPYLWGTVYLAGAIAFAASALVNRAGIVTGYRTLGVVHLLLAASLVATVIREQHQTLGTTHASLIGIPTFLWVAAMHFICVFAYQHPPRITDSNEEADAA